MKKRILYSLLLTALTLNLLLGARLYFSYAQAGEKDDVYQNIELFTRVLERVRKDYVDGDKLTYKELIYSALKGMLNSLDPHSEFMDAEKYNELKNDTEGLFGGVGIVISVRDNFLTVVAPMEDTPAFKAGILTGDRIIKIEGKSTERLSLPDAVKRLRGAPGTEVNITVLRPMSGQVRDIKLTRAEIKVDTVKDINGKREFPIGEGKIGYIRLTQFGEQTGSELDDALKRLDKQGMQALILDLRNNPGGLLDQAAKVCEKFLPKNQLIVSTEGRHAEERTSIASSGRGAHPNLPLVILVNNGSASASEIVAGCLQDTTTTGVSRAVILGEQTFGKGSVQKILPVGDGSALRLTTAKYYTPSHKVIHEKGITPDIVVPMTAEEEEALFLRRIPGGLETLPADQREKAMSLHDTQLERAMDVLKGIALYAKRASVSERVPGKKGEKVAVAN
ncbi:MAG: carboxyl-terminal protease [Verrucomicrobia bacterium]|nr:MAG: carboxyl-terminal protease [Verrucomicrobiota bacterium]